MRMTFASTFFCETMTMSACGCNRDTGPRPLFARIAKCKMRVRACATVIGCRAPSCGVGVLSIVGGLTAVRMSWHLRNRDTGQLRAQSPYNFYAPGNLGSDDVRIGSARPFDKPSCEFRLLSADNRTACGRYTRSVTKLISWWSAVGVAPITPPRHNSTNRHARPVALQRVSLGRRLLQLFVDLGNFSGCALQGGNCRDAGR